VTDFTNEREGKSFNARGRKGKNFNTRKRERGRFGKISMLRKEKEGESIELQCQGKRKRGRFNRGGRKKEIQ